MRDQTRKIPKIPLLLLLQARRSGYISAQSIVGHHMSRADAVLRDRVMLLKMRRIPAVWIFYVYLRREKRKTWQACFRIPVDLLTYRDTSVDAVIVWHAAETAYPNIIRQK